MTNHTDYIRLHEITERLTQRYSDLDQRLDQIEAHLADIVDATDALLHAHGICSNCHRPVETCDAEIIDAPEGR